MKKTLNVNIGSVAFTVDEDAYQSVKEYLDDIESRLDEDTRDEVMQDVEARIADILCNNLSVPGQVVTLQMVGQAISVIGRAEYFGERHRTATPPPPPINNPQSARPRRLYRSRSQKAIAGLCGGIAEYFGWDTSMVRVATFLLVFFGGLSLWVYIILWIVIPLEPVNYEDQYYNRKQQRQ